MLYRVIESVFVTYGLMYYIYKKRELNAVNLSCVCCTQHTAQRFKMTELTITNKNPYPPPTALYSDLVHDPNLFMEKLQSFHDSFGTKLK
jgi:hypothetical protein